MVYWKRSKNNLETIVKKHMFKGVGVAPITMLGPQVVFPLWELEFCGVPKFLEKKWKIKIMKKYIFLN